MPLSTSLYPGQRTRLNVSRCSSRQAQANQIADINSELDELDREEFYRLKKVSNKKQRDQAAMDKEMKAKRQQEQQNGVKKNDDEDEEEAKDVLGEHEDDDVIF